MTEIRQFLLTEPQFPKHDLPAIRRWLESKKNASYKFRIRKPKDFPVGSIAVFSYEGKYIGTAVTNGEVVSTSGDNPYTGRVSFDPDSIKIFRRCPARLEGKKFCRNLVKLTWSQYQDIVRMTGETG